MGWIAYLEGCGYQCVVGKGAEDAKRQIGTFFDQLNKDAT